MTDHGYDEARRRFDAAVVAGDRLEAEMAMSDCKACVAELEAAVAELEAASGDGLRLADEVAVWLATTTWTWGES